jgi:hypothetical protein
MGAAECPTELLLLAEEARPRSVSVSPATYTFATQYLRSGRDVVRLSIILGHSDVSTTMKYLHLLTEDLQRRRLRRRERPFRPNRLERGKIDATRRVLPGGVPISPQPLAPRSAHRGCDRWT